MPSNVQPPRGMRDFLPDDKALREGVMAVIRDSFSAFGYREIETPVAEELDRLESGQGGDNEKLIFKILRRGLDPDAPLPPSEVADLGLRFDLTLPLARFYATHRGELPSVFRAIQMGSVWRAERPQRGRYRQFTQCDIDVLGEPSNVAEVELIVSMAVALRRLGVEGSTVRLNDRRVLFGMLDSCGFAPEARLAALITVDKLDKIGLPGVADELRGAGGDPTPVDLLIKLLEDLLASGAGTASRASGAGGASGAVGTSGASGAGGTSGRTGGDFEAVLAALPPAVDEVAGGLVAIRDAVRTVEPDLPIVADPTLVRGMGYYTGPIYELAHPDSSGSIGAGGRYDGMIGRFAGTEVAACGFSLGFERVIGLVDPARVTSPRRQVAVLYDDTVPLPDLLAAQRRLIEAGVTARLVRRTRNLGRLLDGLAGEGFDAYVSLPGDDLDPRPLAGRA